MDTLEACQLIILLAKLSLELETGSADWKAVLDAQQSASKFL